MIVNNSPIYAMNYQNNLSQTKASTNKPQTDESNAASENVIIPVKTPKLATPCGRLVSHRDLLSRSKPLMSDEGFLNAAREQARKDFARGIRAEADFSALRDAFISVVSPDRVGLVESLFRNPSNTSNGTYIRDLLHAFMLQEEGLEDSGRVSNVTVTPTGDLASMFVHDSAGNIVVMYCHWNGWAASWTPEEWERHHKILEVYNDEWFALYKEAKAENNRFELMQNDMGIGAFDVEG
jgi:hypothetical protein